MQLRKDLITEIQSIIAASKEAAIRSVDHQRVIMYWKVGQKIFEEEQGAKDRAEYGTYLVQRLSQTLQPQHGSGFSVRQLERYRQFYRTFPIASTLRTQFNWTHYKLLIGINKEEKREFYIAETGKNNWTARQLERQINSQLFERLLMSKDVESVLAVARKEKQPSHAKDIIKDPMVLEFLGLKRESSYYERDLEVSLITHLQEFMLELGNGFSFVARQKRIHIDGDEFSLDLVFYNRLLQCFVLVEIITKKVTHEDLGQLQMYVNYYDRFEKQPFENATIGILLCADKNDAMVKISLPEANKTIVASKYQLYLPSEKQLIEELNKTLQQTQDDRENIEKMNVEDDFELQTPNTKQK
ncbi:MAG TPA: PDDEXK nuclease domain-containing protein [Flavisolibacter sp.]|jgi:predicted nuclease of restriction endonuclease-like (RecB) superfamily|nr:PDDEXK nuclease domain-containing protein [Flavisolibacter sp.]